MTDRQEKQSTDVNVDINLDMFWLALAWFLIESRVREW